MSLKADDSRSKGARKQVDHLAKKKQGLVGGLSQFSGDRKVIRKTPAAAPAPAAAPTEGAEGDPDAAEAPAEDESSVLEMPEDWLETAKSKWNQLNPFPNTRHRTRA